MSYPFFPLSFRTRWSFCTSDVPGSLLAMSGIGAPVYRPRVFYVSRLLVIPLQNITGHSDYQTRSIADASRNADSETPDRGITSNECRAKQLLASQQHLHLSIFSLWVTRLHGIRPSSMSWRSSSQFSCPRSSFSL